MDTEKPDTTSNDDGPLDPRRLEQLRERLIGRRALLVSDRANRELEHKLHSVLGLKLTWVNSKHARKLQSAKRSVQSGTCDFVLIASSFMGHKVDAVLKGACKQSGTLFVDVKQGKFHSCVRALASVLLPGGS